MAAQRKNFADAFCEGHSIPRERFADGLLHIALYPHARLPVGPVNVLTRREFWEPDREILNDVGLADDLAGVSSILGRMPWYYGRRWRFRHRFRLRVSSRRVLEVARRSLAERA